MGGESREALSQGTADAGRFTWPPRVVRYPPVVPVGARGGRGAVARGGPIGGAHRSAWREFEDAFLDVTAPPLAERAAEAGWRPDLAAEYCGRCGRSASTGGGGEAGLCECAGVEFAWQRLVRLGEYRGGLRRWIHEVKFTRWRRLGDELGRMLGASLGEAAQRDGWSGAGRGPVIVPVPDSPLRRVMRGIDHAAVIARGVSAATGWEVATVLRRRTFAKSQLRVRASERAANVARAFDFCEGSDARVLAGRLVVAVDDVVTTGATMRTCCRLIASACRRMGSDEGTTIWAGCLARTESRRETAGGR